MVTWTPAAESCRLGRTRATRRHPTNHTHSPVRQHRRRSASGTPATRRRPCAAPPRSAGSAAARCCTRPRCRCHASWSPACGEKAFNEEKSPKVWAAPAAPVCHLPNVTRGTPPDATQAARGITEPRAVPEQPGGSSSEKEQLPRSSQR